MEESIKKLFDELVEIANMEYGNLYFYEDMSCLPAIYFIPTNERIKAVMYTPLVEKIVVITNIHMMLDNGIKEDTVEFRWAYEAFHNCCPALEFRPAKSLKNWPTE